MISQRPSVRVYEWTNNELQRIWRKKSWLYIKVLFQHLLGWTEENHKNFHRGTASRLRTQCIYEAERNIWKLKNKHGKGMWTGSAEPTTRTEMSCAKPFISSSSRTLTAGRDGFVGARRMAISMWPTSCSVMEWSPVMRKNWVCRSALTSSTVCMFGPTWWQNHASRVINYTHRKGGKLLAACTDKELTSIASRSMYGMTSLLQYV